MLAPWKKSYDEPWQHIKKQRHYFADNGPSSQSRGFSSSHVQMWELDHKEGWAPKNWCFWIVVLEKTLENPLDCKEIKPVNLKGNQTLNIHWKDWYWSWNSNTLATWCEELTPLKRPWCWERLMAGGEGDDRGWDGWMASPTQWTWVWVDSGSWWWTGRPGVLRFMGLQRVRHDWATELNWTDANSRVIGKDPDAGKDWRQEEKGTTEDETVGWYHLPGSSPGWSRVFEGEMASARIGKQLLN